MNIGKINKIHIIGIGGMANSYLARFFLHHGKQVSGSDISSSVYTDQLAQFGVVLFKEQLASNISNDIDLVIYTDAIPEDN